MKYVILCLLLFFTTNCVSIGVSGPDSFGLLYSNVTRSESLQFTRGPKKGKACQKSFLQLAAFGDNSITTAAEKENITSVYSINYSETRVLLGIFYRENCTLITGN
ncbi:MAG: TRL domain-containing protein [Spirochaetota bacterium]